MADVWLTAEELLQDWLGEGAPVGQEETIQRWIGRGERLLRREFPTLSTRLTSGQEPDLAETVKDVLSAMVTRVLRNPEGQRTFNKTAGPYSESVTYGGDTPGSLFLTDAERASLREPGKGQGKAYSISLQNTSPTGGHLLWCSNQLVGGRCSCGADIAGRPIYEGGE
ncbi:Gp19/Gp15/Gp42 family protein [Actinotignum urinale]|uniref:Gp19/Gp15/Gp42 family protein n=1 Tax=Actinotignum urinale TaxID=190146 RepID=A0AAW9HV39_9ACTO|nr:Gp19/Gp15/Gp42 family protein [Actinotignum urinale]MDY5132244.1 Gp19/Gp15/Gp42 family protein [Actinotignum urinale]MDY5151342.1 Gp19/Gp15/Gp42 family protein [Actinotignum urinale]MDY5154285.1 Gp19/Gp15/Gp42 family protein [Actinotignum urinale]WIK58857.1 Gp19/Gp15/Gp42 family protein [Actinotignum urinale]